MDQEMRRKQAFLLRLPLSVREEAEHIAHMDGTSLNHFISLAVAEKISRMGQVSETNLAASRARTNPKMLLSAYGSKLSRAG